MQILIAAGIISAILTLFFFGRSIRCTRRGKLLRACGSSFGGISSLGITLLAGLLLFNYLTYSRLTAEQVVSRVEFQQVGTERFEARLMIDGERDRFFTISGNEWQLDARVVSWKPPATILGLEPIYKLERLSGRYADIDREKTAVRTVYGLADTNTVDVWEIARRYPFLLPGVDAYYGTATYVPMADGAKFDVSLSRDALIARPSNMAAKQAVGAWDAN